MIIEKSAVAKIGTRQNMRAIFIDTPADAIQSINSPTLEPETSFNGDFDYIHFFIKSQAEFHKKFPQLKSYLKQSGILWVSWPKLGGKWPTGLTP